MKDVIDVDSVYLPSENVVARVIENEIIIVPLVAGIGDLEDDLFTLNEIGRSVWEKLDGKKSVNEIAVELADEYDASVQEIEKDVIGFFEELLKRKIIDKSS